MNQMIFDNDKYKKRITQLEDSYDLFKNYLFNEPKENVTYTTIEYVYFKVDEIAYNNEYSYMEQILYALYNIGIAFSLVFRYDGDNLGLYIGAKNDEIIEIYRIFNGRNYVHSNEVECLINKNTNSNLFYKYDQIVDCNCNFYNGVLRGDLYSERSNICNNAIIDDLICGSKGMEFTFVVVARPFSREHILSFAEDWSELHNYGQIIRSRQVSLRDNYQSVTYTGISYKVLEYLNLIEKYYEKFNSAVNKGLWEVSVKCYSASKKNVDTIGGIILSNTYSEKAPEIVKYMKIEQLECDDRILDGKERIKMNDEIEMVFPRYSNWYTSNELAVICEMPHRDIFGLPIRKITSYDVSRCENEGLSCGYILHNNKISHNKYYFDINELNRHALVVGLTGGGKTNTLKNMLIDIYKSNDDIPFLIIEPAKKEYWELYKLGCDKLRVFSVGSRKNNLYINPFQRVKGVSLQTHIDYVFSCFKASFIMYPPMPYILERAIYCIYEDCGWDISNDYNRYGDVYPTIENLYNIIPYVVNGMGYSEHESDNLIAAMQARIHSLRVGNKGDTMNVKESFSVELLLNGHIVIELENIGDDEVKAFIISMILIQLLEYRIGMKDSQKELKHIVLIEEAHRLLRNIKSGSGEYADPRGNAVEFFCNMLAELRSKGQGFIIADQIPSKLAPDLIKNTNLKIVHRLVDEEERRLIGKSINMNDRQIEDLSTFKQGVAAVYSEGDYGPKKIRSDYAGNKMLNDRKSLSHDDVCKIYSENNNCYNKVAQNGIEHICKLCPFVCRDYHSEDIYNTIPRDVLEYCIEELKNSAIEGTYIKILNENVLPLINKQEQKYKDYVKKLMCFLSEFVKKSKLSSESAYRMYICTMKMIEENVR